MTDQKIGDLSTGTSANAKDWWLPAESTDGSQNKKVNGDLISQGYRTIWFPAAALTPRSANGCAALATNNGSSDQPDLDYLAFDGAAKEYARASFVLPQSYDGGVGGAGTTFRARFFWRRASGTGGANVVWGARGIALGNSDAPAQNFGSDATVTAAADTTTADLAISDWTGALTLANSPQPGDLACLEVFRDGAAGGDTLDAVDAWLYGVELQYQVARADDRVPS